LYAVRSGISVWYAGLAGSGAAHWGVIATTIVTSVPFAWASFTIWSSRVKSGAPLVGCICAQVVPVSHRRIEPVPDLDKAPRCASCTPNSFGFTVTVRTDGTFVLRGRLADAVWCGDRTVRATQSAGARSMAVRFTRSRGDDGRMSLSVWSRSDRRARPPMAAF